MTILAVTGLKREAEIVGGPGVVAVAGGGDAASLADKARRRLHGDIKGVISIGLAGALVAVLKVGDVVIADKASWPAGITGDAMNPGGCALAARLPRRTSGTHRRQR